MFENYPETAYENDECYSKGVCSTSPALASVQEIIWLYLKELSFYLVRLNNLGISNEKIKETVIYALSNIVTNVEYNQKQFSELIANLYDFIFQSKAIYEKYCIENDLSVEVSKSYFKYCKKFDLTDAIRKGEKYFIKSTNNISNDKKNLFEITYFLIKSLTIKITKLSRLYLDFNDVYTTILNLLDTIRSSKIPNDKILEAIQQGVKVYYYSIKTILNTQIEKYGKISQTEVSFSTIPGKAILVSGSDLKKLENVLKAVENTNISVYTHGMEMFMAHAFPKFRNNKNLIGHFGSGLDSSIVDFATFPGAILMTKATIQRVEYLFRGRLFTLDPVPPVGVVRIVNNDYRPLVKSALEAKGFSKATSKPSMKVGFDENFIIEKINEIINMLKKKEIENIFIIGMINYPNLYKKYFEKLLNMIPKNSFVISLDYPVHRKNSFYIDSFYDYTLIYEILNFINEKTPLKDINITVYLTKCDRHTISNLLFLKEIGVKNVFTCKCPPSIINPTLMQSLKKFFGIREFSDVKKDLGYINE